MTKFINISVLINTRNEAVHIKKCISSVRGFADEVIVVDMFSRDKTVAIAKSLGAKVYRHKFLPWVEPARNYAIGKARGNWILILDPDEYLTSALKNELLKISKRIDVNFVKIPRKNMIFGKWLRHSNMWPDYVTRFFRKDKVKWSKKIHSQPKTIGQGTTMLDSEKLAIRHNNYTDIDDFVKRALRYSSTQANELIKSGYKLKTGDLLLRPIQEFNSRFFANSGYKDSFHGLAFCLLQAFAICLIYLKIWQKQGFEDKVLAKGSFVSASLESSFEYNHWFSRYFTTVYSKNFFKNIVVRLNQLLSRLIKNF